MAFTVIALLTVTALFVACNEYVPALSLANLDVPSAVKVPPRVVAPVPTEKVFAPEMLVLAFTVIALLTVTALFVACKEYVPALSLANFDVPSAVKVLLVYTAPVSSVTVNLPSASIPPLAVNLPVTVKALLNVKSPVTFAPPAETVKPPLVIVAPPSDTVSPLPIVAAPVVDKLAPLIAPVTVNLLLNVESPVIFAPPAETVKPPLVIVAPPADTVSPLPIVAAPVVDKLAPLIAPVTDKLAPLIAPLEVIAPEVIEPVPKSKLLPVIAPPVVTEKLVVLPLLTFKVPLNVLVPVQALLCVKISSIAAPTVATVARVVVAVLALYGEVAP